MADKNLCLVGSAARAVIKFTKPKHSRKLLAMLPADLSQTIITDGNINQIIARINRFRHEREDDFALASGLGADWEEKIEKRKRLRQLLDRSSDELNLTQEALKKQIKFLSNLSRSIYELKFVRTVSIVRQIFDKI